MIKGYLRYGDIIGKLQPEDINPTIEKIISLRCKYYAFKSLIRITKNYKDFTTYLFSLYEKEYEQERNKYWLPIYKKSNLPYLFGYNCLSDFNGDLYVAIDLNDYIEIPEEYIKGVKKMPNIKDFKPSDGTIIGKLTDDELKK
ncbi:hypothetical protein [Metabacillus sp. Hm71]|uniref:hypothetical protein n=1 Tax=Metabacillus sp. Hm71 TaxID=3450743 RepID=UPI003F42875B